MISSLPQNVRIAHYGEAGLGEILGEPVARVPGNVVFVVPVGHERLVQLLDHELLHAGMVRCARDSVP